MTSRSEFPLKPARVETFGKDGAIFYSSSVTDVETPLRRKLDLLYNQMLNPVLCRADRLSFTGIMREVI